MKIGNIEQSNLIKQLKKLSSAELSALIYEVKKQKSLINHYRNGVVCPKCGQKHIQKFGKCVGQQRYRCKDCKKTFTEYTNTVFSATKKDYSLWLKYLDLMMQGTSLYNISKKLNISVMTAFRWRHKVLDAIKKKNAENKVNGVVETDETFLLYSHKGEHINGVEGRTRGGVGKHRGISKDQVGILVAIDRDKNTVVEVYGRGKISAKILGEVLGNRIEEDSVLVTDSCKSYIKFAEEYNLQLKQIARGKHRNGEYHINDVNAYHSGLKHFLLQFKGISTKHLNNYLNWYQWKRTGFDNNVLIKDFLLRN